MSTKYICDGCGDGEILKDGWTEATVSPPIQFGQRLPTKLDFCRTCWQKMLATVPRANRGD